MIVIERQEEMEKYYVAEVNTYVFDDDVMFNCDIKVIANIFAFDLYGRDVTARDVDVLNIRVHNIFALNIKAVYFNACNIEAYDVNAHFISACDINAREIRAVYINARDIKYYAVCYAYKNIRCNSITGTYEKHKHFCLDGELIIKDIKEGELE